MTPITPAELLLAHSARELAELATPEGQPSLYPDLIEATVRGADRSAWAAEEIALADEALLLIQDAIDTANARCGRAAAGRVLSTNDDTTLRAYASDIARSLLYGDARLSEEHPVRLRYRDAMRFLERVGAGTEVLGQDVAGGGGGSPQYAAADRVFTADSLAGF